MRRRREGRLPAPADPFRPVIRLHEPRKAILDGSPCHAHAEENEDPLGMDFYAGICGWTLARAHARSGDAVAMSAYLGKGDAFDKAIADFSKRYADQNERDYEAFARAVEKGRLEAVEGV
jgi:hypothetical protein